MPKLVIIDDEVDIREFAKNFFQKRKIDVLTSSGGEPAVALVASEKPDLVLLDVRMGEMSGVDVLRRIRENNKLVKVIMVTGVMDEDVINTTKELGISGYIHKPLVLNELEKIVLAELEK